MVEIEPTFKLSGSAFQDNNLNNSRPRSFLQDADQVQVCTLSEWCEKNFITKRIGRKLIKRKLLIGFRRHRVWWVRSNPECMGELLDYLGVEELAFDIENL